MRQIILFACVCGTLIANSAGADSTTPEPCPETVGAICTDGKATTLDNALTRLREADVVVLGEKHDNPAHHDWQARLIRALAPAGLAFEMVPQDLEAAANDARASGGDLEAALDWENSGWPDWALYAPLFEAAPAARIAGGGVPRDRLRASVGTGAAKAFGERAPLYHLDRPLPEALQAAMEQEQADAHCGVLPDVMLPGMVEAQRLRDAAFADAALRLHETGAGPVVLIAGNGHARTDRGSPLYLKRADATLSVVAVGILEAGNSPQGVPFDISIYTAKHDRGDPCAEFIKSRQSSD